ncbi:6167_t:CDS:2 [Funneliformis geosporum]|uniref:16629_t:CDS:1 n=1 Tax=Funneliformis geosporum TaxID=1117311 RepID=A0A9W4SCM9_9GLOM|nr:16629_t:CDS:2 [Funneliformis geosporum]CAI2169191.1 6167_t:CDS:2 [Funneliformis geosporum]
MQSNLQPAVLFNKNLSDDWQKVSDEMKKNIEATPGTPGDITFPKPNITFLCFSHEHWDCLRNEREKNMIIQNLTDRIQRTKQRHAKAVLLIYLDSSNIQPLYEIQARLLLGCVSINILPVHNPKEAVNVIDIIATGVFPDKQPPIAQQLIMEQNQCINNPASLTAANKWVHLVLQMSAGTRNLRLHECYFLQEGLQTIHNMATATLPQLLDCSLDSETAQDVIKFFEEDYVA